MAGFADLMDTKEQPKNIFEAAERGDTAYICRVVDRTVEFDINQTDKLGRTALHWAAEMGHTSAAEALIDYGIDVAAQECNGRTAVHLAARAGNADMIKTLMTDVDAAKRAQVVNMTDNYGITAVFLTKQKGDEGREAFEALMSFGGRFNDMTMPKQATPPTAIKA